MAALQGEEELASRFGIPQIHVWKKALEGWLFVALSNDARAIFCRKAYDRSDGKP